MLFKITVLMTVKLMPVRCEPSGTALVYDLPGGWMQWLAVFSVRLMFPLLVGLVIQINIHSTTEYIVF